MPIEHKPAEIIVPRSARSLNGIPEPVEIKRESRRTPHESDDVREAFTSEDGGLSFSLFRLPDDCSSGVLLSERAAKAAKFEKAVKKRNAGAPEWKSMLLPKQRKEPKMTPEKIIEKYGGDVVTYEEIEETEMPVVAEEQQPEHVTTVTEVDGHFIPSCSCGWVHDIGAFRREDFARMRAGDHRRQPQFDADRESETLPWTYEINGTELTAAWETRQYVIRHFGHAIHVGPTAGKAFRRLETGLRENAAVYAKEMAEAE